jgi:hypothetical protein
MYGQLAFLSVGFLAAVERIVQNFFSRGSVFFLKLCPNSVQSSPKTFRGLGEEARLSKVDPPKSDGPEVSVTNQSSLISPKRHRLPGWWE